MKYLVSASFLLIFLAGIGVAQMVGLGFQKTISDSNFPTNKIGDWGFTNPFERHPQLGDMVVYKCYNKEKCPNYYTWNIAHRLTKIDERGCMTFIGDNPAYDWSGVPCLMRDEFVLLGVEHKL